MKKIVTVTLNPCIDKTIYIDGFEYGGLNRVRSEEKCVGGKGINCAVVLKSMGCNVFSCGITAGGETEKYLDSLGIPYGFTICKGQLRTNYKIVNGIDRITTEINERGFVVSSESLKRFTSLYETTIDNAGAVIMSGSVPQGVDDNIYFRLARIAKEKDIPVIMDADGDRLKAGVKAKPYCIKPNLYEARQLLGEPLDTVAEQASAAKRLVSAGIKLVIISLGKDGAIAADKNQTLRVYAPGINCISTVGAGDSMTAAAAYGIASGAELETIAKTAVCAGSMTAQNPGLCNGLEALKNYKKITAEIIG